MKRWLLPTIRQIKQQSTATKKNLPRRFPLRIDSLEDRVVLSTMAFSSLTHTVNENGGMATITVERDDTVNFESVNYATDDGTAISSGMDVDYWSSSGTLWFMPGQATASFQVSINDDSVVEGTESLSLILSDPSMGATLDPMGQFASLTITDNDSGGSGQSSGDLELLPVTDQTGLEGTFVRLQPQVRFGTSGALQFSATGLPVGLQLDSATGVLAGQLGYGTASLNPYNITLTVSDGQQTDSVSFLWTVGRFSLDEIAPRQTLLGESGALALSWFNPSAEPLTFTATGLPNGVEIDPLTGSLINTPTVSEPANAPFNVAITASSGDFSMTRSFTWDIHGLFIEPIEDQENLSDEPVYLEPLAWSLATPLTWSATNLPNGLTIDSATGTISGTIASSAVATTPYTVTLTASMGTLSRSMSFDWRVASVALATPDEQMSFLLTSEPVELALDASSTTNDPLSFSATNLPTGLTIDDETGAITGTISTSANTTEPYEVTVSVTDGLTTRDVSFAWRVLPFDIEPLAEQWNLPSDTINLPLIITAESTATPTITATGLPAGLSITGDVNTGFAITGTLEATHTAEVVHDVLLTVTLDTWTVTREWRWHIANQQFTVTPPNLTTSVEGDVISNMVSANDPLGSMLTYAAHGLPAGVLLDSATGVLHGTIGQQAAGTYSVLVWATTDRGTTAASRFTWTIQAANVAPTILDDDEQLYLLNEDIEWPLYTSDADGDELTITVTGLPAGLVWNPTSSTVTGSVATPTTATITVSANDGVLTTTRTFDIVVAALHLAATDEQTVRDGQTVALHLDVRGVTDPTYSATGLPTGLSINAETGIISGTITHGASNTGTFTSTVTVTDGSQSANQTIVWHVGYLTIEPIADQVGHAGEIVTLPVSVDASSSETIVWSATGLPDGLSIDAESGQITGLLPHQISQATTYPVTVTATASLNRTASTTFDWNVSTLQFPEPVDQSSLANTAVELLIDAASYVGTVSFAATGLPAGLSLNSSTGEISGTIALTAARPEPYVVAITVSNGTASLARTFSWQVGDVQVASTLPLPIVADVPFTTSLGVLHDPMTTLSYRASGLPQGVMLDPMTGQLSGTIPSSAVRALPYHSTIEVMSPQGTELVTIEWTVRALHIPDRGNQANGVGDPVALHFGVPVDPSWTVNYSATGLPAGLSIDSAGRILGTISDTANTTTPHNVTVTVSVGTVSVEREFLWSVRPFTFWVPADLGHDEGDVVELDLAPVVQTGTTLTWSATGLPTGLSIDPNTGIIAGTVATLASNNGPFEGSITATAGTYTLTREFVWPIRYLSLAPVAAQVATAGHSVTLNLVGTTPNEEPATWSATGLPTGLSIDPQTGVISGTVAATLDDGDVFTPTVTLATATHHVSQTFAWTVQHLTLTEPTRQLAATGHTIEYALTGLATGNASITYTASNLPQGLTINATTGVISGTITAPASGGPTVTVTATAGDDEVTHEFAWLVGNGQYNLPTPTNQTLASVTNVFFNVADPEADLTGVELTVEGLPEGLTFDATSGVISGRIAEDVQGTFTTRVHAVNTQGESDYQSFTWNVQGVNEAPTLAEVAPFSLTKGEAFSLTLSATDSDPSSLRYYAEGLPDGLTLNATTGVVSGTPTENVSEAETRAIKFHATDGTLQAERVVNANYQPSTGGAGTLAYDGPPPTSGLGLPTIHEGTQFFARVQIPGFTPNAHVTIRITWGDTSESTEEVTADGDGMINKDVPHTYPQEGTKTIKVYTKESGQAELLSVQRDVTVLNVAPKDLQQKKAEIVYIPPAPNSGGTGFHRLTIDGSFEDPGDDTFYVTLYAANNPNGMLYYGPLLNGASTLTRSGRMVTFHFQMDIYAVSVQTQIGKLKMADGPGMNAPSATIAIDPKVTANILTAFHQRSQVVVNPPPNTLVDRIFSFAGDAIDSVTQWVSVTAERATNYLADVAKSIQQMADALSKAEEILNTLFNVHARQAIDMFLEQPIGFVNNVLSALGQGLQRYVDHLGANLKEGLISWLAQKAGITLPANLDLSKPEQAIGVVLNMMGLSPRELVLAAIQQSGSKNAAILAQAYHYVEKFLVDPANSTASVIDAIKHLANLPEFAEYKDSIQDVLKELDTKKLFDMAIEALKKAVLDSLSNAITKTVMKKINPSIGAITTMIDIGRWFVNNIDLIGDFVTEMSQAVPHLKNNVPEAALAVERGLKKATPMVISLVASLANLDKLPEEARKAMQGLGATVRATLVTALSKALIVAEKVVKSRWPKKSNGEAPTTGYAGQASDIKRWSVPTGAKAETHTLHATTGNDNPTGTSGQASNNNNTAPATGTVIYRGVKEVPLEKQLQEWNEQTKEKDSDLKKKIQAAVSHLKEKLNPLVNAIAKAFKNFNTKLEALKKVRDTKDSKPQQITTAESESAAALASLANAQQAAEPALQQQATLVQACEADAAGCFAAGTKLWTPQGYQNVEDLREGDLVFSRSEYDPSGLIEAKPIEKAFRRLAEVQHLHLRGPNGNLVTIRTTGEHPFYAFDKGWMPVKELTTEDWVLTECGDWAKVEEVFATGEMEVVYNLRVAEWHTYFVGDEGWGWAAWAHNAYSIALGVSEGLPSFASSKNAKYYKEWKPEMFGYPQVWNAEDINGGSNSEFAKAFGYALSNSQHIYFNVDGFNLLSWKEKYNRVNNPKYGATSFNGGITAWELCKLVDKPSRHSDMKFCTGNQEMSYNQFRTYCADELKTSVHAEKTANPNWRSEIKDTNAIAILVAYLDYDEDFVEAL